jgi:hypothetical protein
MWGPLHEFISAGRSGLSHTACAMTSLLPRVGVGPFLRQVYKGNAFGFQVLHGSEYFRAVELIETRNQAFDVVQLPSPRYSPMSSSPIPLLREDKRL